MQMSFSIGDKAVYPGHGVGEVTAIEEQNICGMEQTFYILRILQNGMQILVPTNNVRSVGMRGVISKKKVAKVFTILRSKTRSVGGATWNRRYREYQEKLKTGSIFEVAEVLRDLWRLKADKELSFGERKLLDTARDLVVNELVVASGRSEDDITAEVEKIFIARRRRALEEDVA
jgi:CarD family transcriptional regulator